MLYTIRYFYTYRLSLVQHLFITIQFCTFIGAKETQGELWFMYYNIS